MSTISPPVISNTKKTIFELLAGLVETVFIPVGTETLRLLPDSIVLGTAILSVLSLCKSYGILLLSMFEMMFIQRVFASIIGSISPIGSGPDSSQSYCQPGFSYANNMRLSLLGVVGRPSIFPSPVMFFLAAVISYMISSIQEFAREIKTLGSDLESRVIVSKVFSGLFLFLILAFRYGYGCETFGPLFISLLLGLVLGLIVMYQNKALFGRESVNLLNLPMILSAAESGRPMYVCAAT